MNLYCDLLIHNVQLASMQDNGNPYGHIDEAAVAIKDGIIVFAGAAKDCQYTIDKVVDGNNLDKNVIDGNVIEGKVTNDQTIDGHGMWLTPGLVDCHTHLVYGGDRAMEFEQRLQGVSYADISKAGGGIKSTVKATREASFDSLLASAIKRTKRLLEEGVTTIEIKSGYGLDLETEIKMLQVAKAVSEQLPLNVESTFLGAHALPFEYQGRADDYIDFVCDTVMPVVTQKQLASCVDVFCESIGFTTEQTRKVFETAKNHGLNVKAHVEQLTDQKGALLAAEFGALSVDHIEYLAEQDIPVIKQAGCVAVLLPGAYYYLNETQKPPIEALRHNNVPMAVATDLNPGSSPVASLLTAMNMASVLFGLTPEEALRGATINGAKALGLTNKGKIAKGMDADLCLWDIQHPSELVYAMNQHRPETILIGGEYVHI